MKGKRKEKEEKRSRKMRGKRRGRKGGKGKRMLQYPVELDVEGAEGARGGERQDYIDFSCAG